VARVNVSWNGPGNELRAVERALRLLLDSTVQVGVNVLVTRALLPYLPELFAHLHTLGVRRVTILRPKPPAAAQPAGAAWYDANRLRPADLQRLRAILTAWRGALALEVDCALTGLLADAPPAILHRRGIYGCTAGRRICTVWSDGRVTPCSFLADRNAGDVRRTPFAELWQRGQNWELLRDPAAWSGHACAVCDITQQEAQ
jgi:radical SAM protein with 4Fe4S-binding SPASM domain